MSDGFLGPNDVVSVDEEKSVVGTTFKVKDMTFYLANRSINDDWVKAWTVSGVECEVLRAGREWQKGKVRISLEFIPDQPESALDDLRTKLTEQ